MKQIKYINIIALSFLMSAALAQSSPGQNTLEAFTKWCNSQGTRAELLANQNLLENGKCTCSYFNSDGGPSAAWSIEADMSFVKSNIEDVGTQLGAEPTDIKGHPARIASFYYDILGQAISSISWSQEDVHMSIKYTQNYSPGYERPDAPGKAAIKVQQLATTLSDQLGTPPSTSGGRETPASTNPQPTTTQPSVPAPPPSNTQPPRPVETENRPENNPATTRPPVPQRTTDPPVSDPYPRTSSDPQPQRSKGSNYESGINLRFGLMGGLTYSGLSYDFGDGMETEPLSRLGYMGGILVDVGLSQRFSLQLPISWKVKGAQAEASFIYSTDHQYGAFEDAVAADGTITHQLNYIELPVVLNVNFGGVEKHFSLGLGAYIAMGLSGTETNDYTLYYNEGGFTDYSIPVDWERNIKFGGNAINDEKTQYLNRWDYGIYGQLSYTINRVMIGASLSYGLADINIGDEWTTEFGWLFVPEVKTISGGFFVAYFF